MKFKHVKSFNNKKIPSDIFILSWTFKDYCNTKNKMKIEFFNRTNYEI